MCLCVLLKVMAGPLTVNIVLHEWLENGLTRHLAERADKRREITVFVGNEFFVDSELLRRRGHILVTTGGTRKASSPQVRKESLGWTDCMEAKGGRESSRPPPPTSLNSASPYVFKYLESLGTSESLQTSATSTCTVVDSVQRYTRHLSGRTPFYFSGVAR